MLVAATAGLGVWLSGSYIVANKAFPEIVIILLSRQEALSSQILSTPRSGK